MKQNKGAIAESLCAPRLSIVQMGRTFLFLAGQIPWNSSEAATDMQRLVEASHFVRIRPFRLSFDAFRRFFPCLFRHLAGPGPSEP